MDRKTPRILLIEPLDHTEVVARWSRFLIDECQAEVMLALDNRHRRWAEQLLPDVACYEWTEIHSLLPTVDLSILITIGNYPGRWWPLLSKYRYWVAGHNLSLWLGGPIYDYSPMNLARWLRDRIRRKKLVSLLEGAQYLLVPTGSMRKHLLDRKPEWPVVTLPFSFPPEQILSRPQHVRGHAIKIFIPGRVDTRFRDYHPVLEALQVLPSDSPTVELVLAGRVFSQSIVDQLARLGPTVKLVFQSEGMNDQLFHEHLADCHFVLAPLRPSVRSGAYREFIGHTKISGAVFDAIAADKILLLPAWHPEVWRKQKGYSTGADLITWIIS
ncbi:MAG: hypothetical protein AAFY91_06890 [Bacteroidota bacterium]